MVGCSSATGGGSGGGGGTGGLAVVGDSGVAGIAGFAGSSGTGGAPVSLPPPTTPNPGTIGIPIESNCSVISDTAQREACQTFVSVETAFVFPALEDISGLSLRFCMDRIRIEFNADIANLGQAYISERTGVIQFNRDLTQRYFTARPPQNFDDHEPLHLLYQCAHVPHAHNVHHTFFFAVQAELDDAIFARSGNQMPIVFATALDNRNNLTFAYNSLTADPSQLGASIGQFAGCPGVGTYLLFGEYLRPNHSIVRNWFAAVSGDTILAGLPYVSSEANDRYMAIIRNLTQPNAELRSRLAPYCIFYE